MIKIKSARKHFISTALSYLGHPYKWGGDDPSGFDCSGFVLECLKTIGLVSETDDFTADSLLRYLHSHSAINQFKIMKSYSPEEGSLLFYLDIKGKANHVVICLDDFYQIGASGGNKEVKNCDIAWSQNAYIKIRPIKSDQSSSCIINLFDSY